MKDIEEIKKLPIEEQIEAKMAIINSYDLKRIPSCYLPETYSDKYFFVCYSQRDYRRVYLDLFNLENAGINIWYDRGNPAGKNWKEFVERNVAPYQCKGALIYVSENSLTSTSVEEEMELIDSLGKPYIAMVLPFENEYQHNGKSVKGKEYPAKEMIDILEENKAISKAKANKLRKYFDKYTLYVPNSMPIYTKAEKITLSIPKVPLLSGRVVRNEDSAFPPIVFIGSIKDSTISKITEQDFFDLLTYLQINSNIDCRLVFDQACLANCKQLISIEIPKTLRLLTIGDYAFANDTKLVRIGDQGFVHCFVGTGAFMNCSSYKTEVIVVNEKGIGDGTFYGCKSLKKVSIRGPLHEHEGVVKSIGQYAFADCSSLKTFSIPDGYSFIDENAFSGCSSLKTIKIGKGLSSIGKSSFADCSSLKTISFPSSIKTIDENAFLNCFSLSKIHLSPYVEVLGNHAFSNCSSLEEVVVNENLQTIGEGIFDGCNKLKFHRWENANYIGTRSNPYFLAYSSSPSNKINSLNKNCFIIGPSAFYGCLFDSILNIDGNIRVISDNSFEKTKGLTRLIIQDNVKTIGENAFSYSKDLKYVSIGNGVSTLGSTAFNECSSLKSVVISDSVNVIDDTVFADCISLESVKMPKFIKKIDFWAFRNCKSLKTIEIPQTVKVLDIHAFLECTSLKEIIYHGTAKQWASLNETLKLESKSIAFASSRWWKNYPNTVVIHCSDKDLFRNDVLDDGFAGDVKYRDEGNNVFEFEKVSIVKDGKKNYLLAKETDSKGLNKDGLCVFEVKGERHKPQLIYIQNDSLINKIIKKYKK